MRVSSSTFQRAAQLKKNTFISRAPGSRTTWPKCKFETRFLFHPREFTFSSLRGTKSFFKHVVRGAAAFNLSTGSTSRFAGLNFFKLKGSSVKFRKRSNVYFSARYTAFPAAPEQFFFDFPRLVALVQLVGQRLYDVYDLPAGIVRTKLLRRSIAVYILNPHLLSAFLLNRAPSARPLLVRLTLAAPRPALLALLNRAYNISPDHPGTARARRSP